MNAIETAMKTRITELVPVGTHVYLNEAPQEDSGDLVVFTVTGRADVTGTAPIATQDIRISCYAQVHANAEGLAAALWEGLQFWQYGAPGLRLGPLAIANRDADWESDFSQHRVTLTWAAQAVEWSV